MGIKIALFITFLLYAAVISQSFFYLLGMTSVTRRLQATSYIEARQLLDSSLRSTLSGVYYATLLSSIVLVTLCVTNPSGLLFISTIVALLAIVIDIIITLKGNRPLNEIINSWSAATYPPNWNQYRNRWLTIYHARQVVNLTGFLALLTGMIFGN